MIPFCSLTLSFGLPALRTCLAAGLAGWPGGLGGWLFYPVDIPYASSLFLSTTTYRYLPSAPIVIIKEEYETTTTL